MVIFDFLKVEGGDMRRRSKVLPVGLHGGVASNDEFLKTAGKTK